MPRTHTNGVDIEYEVSGTGDPLLLVMGLGGQLTDWPTAFVQKLSEHFTVVRFDNRDSGLSTIVDAPAPSRWELIKGNLWPSRITPSYTLLDMANDARGLLDSLGIQRAHVVGMSMGGMISQLVAFHHPSTTRSLCSIMSNTGDRRAGRPTASVLAALARRGQPSRAEALGVTLDLFRRIGGADWDQNAQRQRSTVSLARAYNPGGVLRQSQAISASPDRTGALGQLTMPTLVVHGLDDTLVRPSGGIATANAVPGSRLLMYPRMGHDIPATRHDELVAAIRANTARSNP